MNNYGITGATGCYIDKDDPIGVTGQRGELGFNKVAAINHYRAVKNWQPTNSVSKKLDDLHEKEVVSRPYYLEPYYYNECDDEILTMPNI